MNCDLRLSEEGSTRNDHTKSLHKNREPVKQQVQLNGGCRSNEGNFSLENEGQGRGVQLSQSLHSKENIKMYNRRISYYSLSSHRFRDINI